LRADYFLRKRSSRRTSAPSVGLAGSSRGSAAASATVGGAGTGAGAGTANCGRRAGALAAQLSQLANTAPESGIRWVDANAAGLTLQFTPFEIAERLRQFVEARPSAWVFTSATLAIGDDFGHFAARIGLPEARTLKIDSPFDYKNQARLYLPRDMPEPQHPTHARKFIEACAPLIEASGGRAFLLFTSYRGLAEGVAALEARFPNPSFPVLVQGQAPREALLERFRELGNAVLLATGSFWEGVDVKGEALAIVAIDKLPFASPDDPLLRARLEGIRRLGGNPFLQYQLPQAVLALKQGVGRLIRDFDDFGVIVLGDPRLTTKAYGQVFLKALPPSPLLEDGAAGGHRGLHRRSGGEIRVRQVHECEPGANESGHWEEFRERHQMVLVVEADPIGERENRIVQRRLTGGGAQRSDAAFEFGDAAFENVRGWIVDPRVTKTLGLEVEQRRAVIRAVKFISDILIDGHRDRLGRRIASEAAVD